MTASKTAGKSKPAPAPEVKAALDRVEDYQLDQLKIEWVPYASIRPNKYNPNKMGWKERQLLRNSLLEDGWTAPIITLPDRTIVDGEQRWTTAGMETTPAHIQQVIERMVKRGEQGALISDSILRRLRASHARLEAAIAEGLPAAISSITRGLVPITVIDLQDEAHRMISTIRHNAARGSHQVDAMSSITAELLKLGLDTDDLMTRLGMDAEEVTRLAASAEANLKKLEAELGPTFSPAQTITHVSDNAVVNAQFEASAKAAEGIKQRQLALAQQEEAIREETARRAAALEAERGQAVSVLEREKIEASIKASLGPAPALPKVAVRKFECFVAPDEFEVVMRVLGAQPAARLVEICRSLDTPAAPAPKRKR